MYSRKTLKYKLSLVILIGALNCNTTSYAQPIDALKNELNDAKNNIQTTQDEIESLDDEISNTTIELDEIDSKINDKTTYINNLNNEITQLSKLKNKRVREAYKAGNYNLAWLKIMFQSQSILEVYDNYNKYAQVVKSDKEIIDDLDSKLSTYEDEVSNLSDLKQDKNDKLADLTTKKSNSKKLLDEYNNSVNTINLKINIEQSSQIDALMKDCSSINDPQQLQILANSLEQLKPSIVNPEVSTKLQSSIDSLKAKIASITQAMAAQASTQSNGIEAGLIPPETQSKVIQEAYKYLGIPYLWGGTDPKVGLDCSGLTQLVYHNLGYNLSRTTYTQVKEGVEVPVSLDKLQAGDLIFFGSPSAPHHVALYIGDNKYIHAPHTGDFVKVSSGALNACCARRILK